MSLQALLPKLGPFRPYLGAGPMFVSLGNDFVVWRQDIYQADPDNPDQYALAKWKKYDVGAQVIAGVALAVLLASGCAGNETWDTLGEAELDPILRDGKLVGIFTTTDVCRSFCLLLRSLFPKGGDDAA